MQKAKSKLMSQHSYHERDYIFGQMMLKLRISLGLTQAALAERLGVSRRALEDCEIGSAYPKAEHLKACSGVPAYESRNRTALEGQEW